VQNYHLRILFIKAVDNANSMTLTFIRLFLIVIIAWSILLSVYSTNGTIMPAVNAQSSGEDVDSLYSKALDAMDQDRYEEAIGYLDTILNVEPNNVDALTGKGDVLYDLERYPEAIEYIDKALAIEPNDTYALTSKADNLYDSGRAQEAIVYYDKALAIDPNYMPALIGKGNAPDD
jgi:tetratricopeptide (TPR) repeat protein